MLRRLERDAVVAALLLAAGAALWWPQRPGRPLGVLGGLALVGIGYAGIRAGVRALGESPETRGSRRRSGFVKFFTRHAILALAAYGMMARLKLDPVGMLVGVSSLALAAGLEAARGLQAQDDGGSSR